MKRVAAIITIVTLGAGISGCALLDPPSGTPGKQPHNEEISLDQFAQTDFNRTVTIAMRDNLESLNRLLEKLYRRNPSQWRKSGAPDLATAIQRAKKSIQTGQRPPQLNGLSYIQMLSVSLDPGYQGDRVAAFVFGLTDMIIQAHNGKTRFYVSDNLTAQHIYNAARNVEVADWMLVNRRDTDGRPLLLANEISGDQSNLSFEREFGQIIGRLDLVANLLDENLRRIGINYMQGLLFFNFLPVR